MLQTEFPATCAGGFAAFCLKDTKKHSDVDIFCYVDIEKEFVIKNLPDMDRMKDKIKENVTNMIKRQLVECNIWGRVRHNDNHFYPDSFGIVFKILDNYLFKF